MDQECCTTHTHTHRHLQYTLPPHSPRMYALYHLRYTIPTILVSTYTVSVYIRISTIHTFVKLYNNIIKGFFFFFTLLFCSVAFIMSFALFLFRVATVRVNCFQRWKLCVWTEYKYNRPTNTYIRDVSVRVAKQNIRETWHRYIYIRCGEVNRARTYTHICIFKIQKRKKKNIIIKYTNKIGLATTLHYT